MTIYYVSTTGSDRDNGRSGSPFKTISRALQQNLNPGDEVVVRAGTYRESINLDQDGSSAGYITIRSEVPGGALLRPPSSAWNAVSINANYVAIDGFDIQSSGGGDGIEGNNVHHVKILNNISHHNGESGIQFNGSEFLTIESNTTHNNASSGWFSGISIYQSRNITRDTMNDGFRNIVRNNVSYDNVTRSGQHTDGNGIIIDDFQSTQTDGYPNYTYRTLVDNNLVYGNGGKGIQVTWSDYVTVSNNTAYHNNVDNQNSGTWRGELSNSASSNNTWINNVAVVDQSTNSNNRAIDNTSTSSYRNANVVWENNLTFTGTAGQASIRTDGNNPAPTAANGNLLGVDPRFVNPGTDFNLRPGSSAINAGTRDFGLSEVDVDGDYRAIGTVDIGAQEYGSTPAPTTPTNMAPDARNDSGFRTAHETPIVIAAADLLRNDVDANGDRLTLTAVASGTGGTVVRKATGNVIFTPNADHSGAAGFTYTVSDTKGGFDTARVSLTVGAAPAKPPPSGGKTSGLWTDSGAPLARTEVSDDQAVEVGMKFRVNTDGRVSAVQFYEPAASEGSHPVSLWTENGKLLASEAFRGATGAGWRQVIFDAPVKVEAGETYIASYHAPRGNYAVSDGFFAYAVSSGDLTALKNAGVFSYGSAGSFPNQSHDSSNYWVDVVFTANRAASSAPMPMPKPTVRGTDSGETLVGTAAADVIYGGEGNDSLQGREGNDFLRGHDGNDTLRGAKGIDTMVGGLGKDQFMFRAVSDSTGASRDKIQPGDGTIAFEGIGVAGGDVTNVKDIDANTTVSGNQAFILGIAGKGGLWLTDVGELTLVSGNIDGDGEAEFQIFIRDGAFSADDYIASDFVL